MDNSNIVMHNLVIIICKIDGLYFLFRKHFKMILTMAVLVRTPRQYNQV